MVSQEEERKRSLDNLMAIRTNVVALKSELHERGAMDLDEAVDDQAKEQIRSEIWNYLDK